MHLIRKIGKAAAYIASNPVAAFRGDSVTTTADGVRLLYRHENLIERRIREKGVWEPAETEAVRRLVKAGDVCIDVGANVGYFSLLMASLGASVVAYEPTRYGFERMRANLRLNPSIQSRINVLKRGLADSPATVQAALEARFSLRVLAHTEPETVQLETLDLAWNRDRLDFVKIDVDGHDVGVVRGGIRTLRRFRPVVMAEFSQKHLALYGKSVSDLALAFMEAGYEMCEVLGEGRKSLHDFTKSVPAESKNLLLFPST
jgi:FkbM family methyltransferase